MRRDEISDGIKQKYKRTYYCVANRTGFQRSTPALPAIKSRGGVCEGLEIRPIAITLRTWVDPNARPSCLGRPGPGRRPVDVALPAIKSRGGVCEGLEIRLIVITLRT